MRILLDESLPRPLSRLLAGHEVRTVTQMGWTSLNNGALLHEASKSFDVLLTADQGIEFPTEPESAAHRRDCPRRPNQPHRVS